MSVWIMTTESSLQYSTTGAADDTVFSFSFGQVRFLRHLRCARLNPTTARIGLGTVHRCPSVPPSVSIGPPTVVVDYQPQLDRVLLEKKARSEAAYAHRGTRPLV